MFSLYAYYLTVDVYHMQKIFVIRNEMEFVKNRINMCVWRKWEK